MHHYYFTSFFPFHVFMLKKEMQVFSCIQVHVVNVIEFLGKKVNAKRSCMCLFNIKLLCYVSYLCSLGIKVIFNVELFFDSRIMCTI